VERCVQQELLRSELRLRGGAERLIQQKRSGYLTAPVTPVSGWLKVIRFERAKIFLLLNFL
jgi:hypothetical protein